MRVLVVGRSVLPFGPHVGGAELASYYLAVSLADLGHHVHFVTDVGDLSAVPERVVVHDVSTWYKKAISRTYGSFSMWLVQHLVANLLAARKARCLLRQKTGHFDVVHGGGNLATLLLSLSRRDAPLVYAEHDPGPWEGRYRSPVESGMRKAVFRALDVEVFRRADHTIFLNEVGEQEAREKWGVPPERVSTIPYGVDLELFSPRPDGDQSDDWPNLPPRYCLYVGALSPRKGVDELLSALVGVNIRLVVAGDGPLRDELELLAQQLGLAGRVFFLGSVSRVHLPELYRRADMLVLPSRADAMPLVLLEAMASGTPPVTTEFYGISKLVQHGHNGFLFASGDIDGLRATIEELVADPAVGERLGRNARSTVERNFSWRTHAQEMTRVYDRLVKPRGATSG